VDARSASAAFAPTPSFGALRSAGCRNPPGSFQVCCITEETTMMERFWRVVGFVVLIALGAGVLWYQGPLLVRDFGIGPDVEEATQARLVKGQCKSRLVIYFCDLTIDQNPAGATQRTELHYLFVDFSFSDYSVRLLSPKGDRSTVTTDIGQDKLWNRAITLATLSVFFLAMGIAIPFSKGGGKEQGARTVST
jgi:hypothetical protein